jgi:hypothetical protein
MITINTTPDSCATPVGCLNIELETDGYVTGACDVSFIAITLKDLPSSGDAFTLKLEDADSVVLFEQEINFKSTVTERNDVLIGADVQETGVNLLKVLTEIDEIMEFCEASAAYDSGTDQYLVTLFLQCTIATFTFTTGMSTSVIDKTITVAATTAVVTEDFKVSAKIIDAPYNSVDAYNTLVDNIDVFFDKTQEASVFLTKRIRPFLSSPVPDLGDVTQSFAKWQKKIKVLFTEMLAGASQDAKATGEFVVINSSDSTMDCSGLYNNYSLELCKDDVAFLWFYVKQSFLFTGTVVAYNEFDEEVFTINISTAISGLHAFQVGYEFLLSQELILEGTNYLRFEITNNATDSAIDVEVNYECNCQGDEKFLFLTERGIFENIRLRLRENKLKVKKELYDSCGQCESNKKAFSVDIENTFSFVSGRIDYSDRNKWKEFISSKEVYWIVDGELVLVTDEGGSVSFNSNRASEINFDFDGSVS